MNLMSLLSAALLAGEANEAEELGFFQKIWNSIVTWFITDRGWMKVVIAVAVIIIGLVILKIILTIFRKVINRTKLKGLAGNMIITIIKTILVFIYLIVILRVLGIDTSSFVALFTVGTLAISLAIQSVISNFASGMILATNRPFQVDDFVEIAGTSGTVVSTSLFSTKLRTPDNKIIVIPNSSVAGGNIVNYSAEEKRRVDLVFGVAYGSDVDKVKKTIESVLDAHELVLHDDGYTVRLNEQGASSLNFVCRCWTKNSDYWTVYFDLTERMTEKFREEGIEIPYNKLDVNVISESAAPALKAPAAKAEKEKKETPAKEKKEKSASEKKEKSAGEAPKQKTE